MATCFLTEMEAKHPEILTNFRKGKLEDADLAILKKVAAGLVK